MKITLMAVLDNGENRGECVQATADVLPDGQIVEIIWYDGKETKALLFERLENKVTRWLATTQKAQTRLAEVKAQK